MKKVLVIGLGVIGYNNAKYMTDRGLVVDGFDTSEMAIQRALENKVVRDVASTFEGYDCYLICISTHDPANILLPFTKGILEIAYRIHNEGRSGALVGIDSTIARGVSRKVDEILRHRLHVAHVPHRFYGNEPIEHGINQIRVLGGCKPCCVDEARYFYGEVLGIPLHIVNSVDIAELTKVVENSYRFLEIAFAEELKMLCDLSSVDFDDLRRAVNTKWNVKILEAREGIGGHCLPKDSQMYLDSVKDVMESSMIETAKIIDKNFRSHRKRIEEPPVARGARPH